jgi:hypothetical protein
MHTDREILTSAQSKNTREKKMFWKTKKRINDGKTKKI